MKLAVALIGEGEVEDCPYPVYPTSWDSLNTTLQQIDSDYILFLDKNSKVDEEFFKELEVDEGSDFFYPNVIYHYPNKQVVKNYKQWENEELIQALEIKEYLPPFGVIIKKEKLNLLEDYDYMTLYAFLYKNLKELKLKHLNTSFIEYRVEATHLDRSYESLLLREVVKQYPLKELFKKVNWKEEKIATATAYTLIGNQLKEYGDNLNAFYFYQKALQHFHNQKTLQELLVTLFRMGEFTQAKEYLKLLEKEKEIYQKSLKVYQESVEEVEKAAQKGEIIQDKAKIQAFLGLKSAQIYNAFGYMLFMQGDRDNSYYYHKQALFANPLDENILHNAQGIAEVVKKEKELDGMLKRVLQK